jgi:hypothetical protein
VAGDFGLLANPGRLLLPAASVAPLPCFTAIAALAPLSPACAACLPIPRSFAVDANYKALQESYSKYAEFGVEVLAFPCNQVLSDSWWRQQYLFVVWPAALDSQRFRGLFQRPHGLC